MAYSDLDAIQVPADEAVATVAWAQQVNDNIAALWGLASQSWKAWDPAPSSITTPGDLEIEGYYHALGASITAQGCWRYNGSTLNFNAVTITLPVAAKAGPAVVGECAMYDASAARVYGGVVVLASAATTTGQLFLYTGALAHTSPVTLTDDDWISVHLFYEAGTVTGI